MRRDTKTSVQSWPDSKSRRICRRSERGADTLIMTTNTVALGRAMTEKNKEKIAEYAYEIWWRNDGKSVLNKGPRQIKLANMEAEMYRGASEADGVPNNTNSAVRDAVKKITHRDKETQRTGRIMLFVFLT